MPRGDRLRVDARLHKVHDLRARIQKQHAFFACGFTKWNEQHQNEGPKALLRVPVMEGDLMRGQSDLAAVLDHFQLNRDELARLLQGNKTIRNAEIYP